MTDITNLTRETFIETLKSAPEGSPALDCLSLWFSTERPADYRLYAVRNRRLFFRIGMYSLDMLWIDQLQAPTANLADAIALLPVGPYLWTVRKIPVGGEAEITDPHNGGLWRKSGATPALAFCAAVLSANLSARSATVHRLSA